ncbi:hypothetical protein GE061_001189 [Apolygus lucorum]|uniref:NADH dehydrogenase [ubiquinone] 1 alpha subcomplex subunit 9, mitochondrial n=1 Tax=Apolygus lucorum TaxID=248454 RepID=A0A6A4KE35_APOLU|nr:hypothetical protein GE061_001189 [Apolygus lucorum]
MALAALKIPSLQRVAPPASSITCIHFYSSKPHNTKLPKIHALKKGTGGRSSFSGIVATVFGSSGFLGRYVCNRLGKIGTQLILPYRGDAGEMLPLKLVGDLGQVLFQPYELRDEESIYKSLMYSNTVINLVGRDWETKNYSFDDVHVEGARTIARLARKAGVENLIHVSALNAAEYPEPYLLPNGSKWLASKWAGENAVREEFPDAVIFRPSDIYGQEDRFLRYFCGNWRHNFKWMPMYKNGECTEKQPVYVGDVAGGIVAACKNPGVRGEVIQAVGPNRYQLSELVDWFHRVMRKDGQGYMRYDLRLDPIFQMRFAIMPKLTLGWPVGNIHMERLEREIHSDQVDLRTKTLEDLGITLTKMEEQVPWELRAYRAWSYYDEDLGEFEEPNPPKTVRI